MSGRFLLDSNIIIALFAREDTVMEKLADAEAAFVPTIALGELYFGAGKSTRVAENIARIDEFAAANTILLCDVGTAKQYGTLKTLLKAKGTPIPENDIWIAALATQYQLKLVTRDSHFQVVDGLEVEQW